MGLFEQSRHSCLEFDIFLELCVGCHGHVGRTPHELPRGKHCGILEELDHLVTAFAALGDEAEAFRYDRQYRSWRLHFILLHRRDHRLNLVVSFNVQAGRLVVNLVYGTASSMHIAGNLTAAPVTRRLPLWRYVEISKQEGFGALGLTLASVELRINHWIVARVISFFGLIIQLDLIVDFLVHKLVHRITLNILMTRDKFLELRRVARRRNLLVQTSRRLRLSGYESTLLVYRILVWIVRRLL